MFKKPITNALEIIALQLTKLHEHILSNDITVLDLSTNNITVSIVKNEHINLYVNNMFLFILEFVNGKYIVPSAFSNSVAKVHSLVDTSICKEVLEDDGLHDIEIINYLNELISSLLLHNQLLEYYKDQQRKFNMNIKKLLSLKDTLHNKIYEATNMLLSNDMDITQFFNINDILSSTYEDYFFIKSDYCYCCLTFNNDFRITLDDWLYKIDFSFNEKFSSNFNPLDDFIALTDIISKADCRLQFHIMNDIEKFIPILQSFIFSISQLICKEV